MEAVRTFEISSFKDLISHMEDL